MRFAPRLAAPSLVVLALAAAAGLGASVADPAPLTAQIQGGDYDLFQPGRIGRVGWAWSNPARTREYWAYVEGAYEWAGVQSTPSNPWRLKAIRTGDNAWPSFQAFQAFVLSQPETQGRSVTFQDHSVVEVTIGN